MTADPHPAALTPDQIARTVWADILARISECPVGWPESGQPLADIIATALRSAAQAERERCVKVIEDTELPLVECDGVWGFNTDETKPLLIAAIRATETDNG